MDLGASVNVFLGYFCDAFQLWELKQSLMIIWLVDQSVKIPRGILEDVFLKVEDFIFPMDFIALHMEDMDAEH